MNTSIIVQSAQLKWVEKEYYGDDGEFMVHRYRIISPTNSPTRSPSSSPSNSPTTQPTSNPTKYPTLKPTKYPTSTQHYNPQILQQNEWILPL